MAYYRIKTEKSQRGDIPVKTAYKRLKKERSLEHERLDQAV
jgi:hypothetical protein